MVALKPMVNFDSMGPLSQMVTDIFINEKRFCEKGLINGGIYAVKKDWLNEKQLSKSILLKKIFLRS